MRAHLLVALLPVALLDCPSGPVVVPKGDPNVLAKDVGEAVQIEATRPAADAFEAWSGVLRKAAAVPGTPLAREAAMAAMAALGGREVLGLESLSNPGLADRLPGGQEKFAKLLDELLGAEYPLDPAVHKNAGQWRASLAAIKGDANGYGKAIAESGCATEATIVGPIAYSTLGPLSDTHPEDAGTFQAEVPPTHALGLPKRAQKTSGHGCNLDLVGPYRVGGLRWVMVDVEVPSAQTIQVGVETAMPLHLFTGGKRVLSVPYGEIAARTQRYGTIEVTAPGTVRLVAKVGAWSSSDSLLVTVFDAEGHPLPTKAPAPGAAPKTGIGAVKADATPAPTDAAGATAWALGRLALGDVRVAEVTLGTAVTAGGGKTGPATSLAYGRALNFARDLPSHKRLERMRAAYEAVLAAWPANWESIIAHAEIVAALRRGGAGHVDAIAEARTARDKAGAAADPLIDAYLAIVGDGIYGVGEDSYARVKPKLAGTWAGYRLSRVLAREADDQILKIECDPARIDVSRFDCASAKTAMGDYAGSLAEVKRLRVLKHQPKLGTEYEASLLVKMGDLGAAKAVYDAAEPGERSMRTAFALTPAGAAGLTWLRGEIRKNEGDPRALLDTINARRALGDASAPASPASAFGAKTKAAIEADRKKPARPDAGTLILAREESYEVEADGFVHAVVYDLRRLGGTQDVDSNAVARVGATSAGAGWLGRTLHRIHKADGTIVEPDRIAAAQAGAELSQIEPGDYVELVSEGWFLARPDGALDLDTPDLLPARTAVMDATITLAMPKAANAEVWSHTELGKPAVTEAGGKVLQTWSMKDHDVRRSEKGQAPMDGSVSVRMGTWSWGRIARDARDWIMADDERWPETSAWVDAAAGKDRAPTLELLARLAKATKRAIPRVGYLSTGVGGVAGYQSYDARTVLLDAQGSRVALMRRALEQLGIKNQIVWSELSPYSAEPKMVARTWRFSHAMIIAWVSKTPGGPLEPVWLDPDVDGNPPPPGRTSPELRGRVAIDTQGNILPVPPNAVLDPDVATIDLGVDDAGNAKGTFALLLKSRDAQDVAAILEEVAGDEIDDALRAYVHGWVPGADITEVKASAETWQVMITAKIEIPGLLVPDGTRFAIGGTAPVHGAGRSMTLGQTYAAQAKRTTALSIRDAIDYTIHRVIRLPAGTAIATPLPAVDVTDETSSLKATRKVKVDGTTLTEDFTFSLPTGVVEPKKFEAFTANTRLVDDGFLSVIRVTPPTSAKPGTGAKPTASTKPTVAKPIAPPKDVKPK